MIDLVELPVDPRLDLIELLAHVVVRDAADAPGDPADDPRLLDLLPEGGPARLFRQKTVLPLRRTPPAAD
ncbi:MAG: hypothetical protein ACPMAQ_12860, partial [Phycisphaerae bacterium]